MTMTADNYVNRVLDALPRATPRREQIVMELRGHIAERRAAGQPELVGPPNSWATRSGSPSHTWQPVPLVAALIWRRGSRETRGSRHLGRRPSRRLVLVGWLWLPFDSRPARLWLAVSHVGQLAVRRLCRRRRSCGWARRWANGCSGLRVVRESRRTHQHWPVDCAAAAAVS